MTDSRTGFGSLHMPRSRGVVSGLLLLVLGAWGALAPFVGPYFHLAYPPGGPWVWTSARAWLELLPGAGAAAGGLLLLVSGNRAIAMLGGCLAVSAGAWLVLGRTLAPVLGLGDVGAPVAATAARSAVVEIAYFSGAGALILLLGGAVMARVSVRTARDAELARQFDAASASQPSDTLGAFDESARTEIIAPAPRHHRRERRTGLFRRSEAGVNGS